MTAIILTACVFTGWHVAKPFRAIANRLAA